MRTFLPTLFLTLCTPFLHAEPETLDAACKRLLAKHQVAGSELSIHVAAVEDGKEIYSLAGHELRGVASNAKLITTAAALHWLGPEYVWRTSVHLVGGKQEGETYTGSLLVIGRGDPNISGRFHQDDPTAIFAAWADQLLAAGVKRIAGDLLLDDLLFDRVRVSPAWPAEQLQNWYCAPVGALALNDDCIDVTVAPGEKAGDPAVVTISPKTGYFTIVNEVKTVAGRKQHNFSIVRTADRNELTVKGGYIVKGGGYTESIAVHDPTRYFGAILRETLARKGIEIGGAIQVLDQPWTPAPPEAQAVTVFESPMPATLQVCNQRSQNFYAEQIFKTLGAVKYGKGTFETGRACVKLFLNVIGVPEEEFAISDGCGLSSDNLYSPAAITRVLCDAWKAPWRKVYVDSLAIGGRAGTLEKRFREEAYRGRVHGKTGYIASVSTLSGYAETQHHGTWAFSILVNHFRPDLGHVREFQDDLVKAWIDWRDGE